VIEPVLNERSLQPAEVPTVERMTSLAAVLLRLDTLGFPKMLRHVRDAPDREIGEGLSLRDWLFRKAPKELKQFIAGRMSRAPFVEDLHQASESAQQALYQASFSGEPANGPGVAYLLDAPAVALRGVACWEVDPLTIVLSQMDEESEAFVEQTVDVVHLSSAAQVTRREAQLRERVLRTVATGVELWERRGDLFGRLDFCSGVESQVRALSGNESFFPQVVIALARLNGALVAWSAGPLSPGMSSSPESTQTLDHGTFGPMRDFLCPDGKVRRFSNHLKLFSGNWRIYYQESRDEDGVGRAFVGYAGTHLPTVRFRT
jgi:hypothetical protein